MITHTNDSHQIPSQNKTKSKLQFERKNAQNSILQTILHATHLLKLFDKMYEYEADPTRTVGANNFVVRGYKNNFSKTPLGNIL